MLRGNGRERAREDDTDKKKEREAVSVCAHPELSEAFIHTLPPSLSFPLTHPPPEAVVFHHSTCFHTPKPNIKVDMKRNEKHSIVFPQTLVFATVICVMPSTGVSRPISLWAVCPPARCLSIRPKTLRRTAVFLLRSLSTRQDSHFVSARLIWPAGCRPAADHLVTVNTQMCTHAA